MSENLTPSSSNEFGKFDFAVQGLFAAFKFLSNTHVRDKKKTVKNSD